MYVPLSSTVTIRSNVAGLEEQDMLFVATLGKNYMAGWSDLPVRGSSVTAHNT